jgi:ribosomal protein S18 acetylase RimI-like enzyme
MDPSIRVIQIGTVRKRQDLERLAELHISEIDTGFISSLGPATVRRIYEGIAASRHAFIFAAYEHETVVGFICGSVRTKCVYRDVLVRQGVMIGMRLLPKLVARRAIVAICETLVYPLQRQCAVLPEAEILNFCVRRTDQRKGIGGILFRRLVEEFQRREVLQIRIVTGAQQTSAQRFYETVGAIRHSEIRIHASIPSIVYTFSIPPAAPVLTGNTLVPGPA